MRRPNLCNNSVTVADDSYKPTQKNKEESTRLSLVRRVLGGGSKKKELFKSFGVPLSELSLSPMSVPVVLQNICLFIELHGLKVEGLWRGVCSSGLVEDLKNQLNRDCESEIDPNTDVSAVALLLLVWLGDLPQPLLSYQATSDLTALIKKDTVDSVWWEEGLVSLGLIRLNSLQTLVRLLHHYTTVHPSSLSYIPAVFAPLITPPHYFSSSSLDLMTSLIISYSNIFKNRETSMNLSAKTELNNISEDNRQKALIIFDPNQNHKQRKRKERQDSTSLDMERKFVRSNSEERPFTKLEEKISGDGRDSMRRVNSHEDFSKARNITHQSRKITEPLHERNCCSPERKEEEYSIGEQLTTTVGYASDLYDDSEHERRRNSERFAPQARRRRTKHYRSSQAKENDSTSGHKQKHTFKHQSFRLNSTIIYNSLPSTPHEFPTVDFKESFKEPDQDEERSPSPISGVSSPTLDMNTFQENDNEPLTAWNNILTPSEERLVSPRNSIVMSKRTFTAMQPEDDPVISDLTTQITNLKRKLKKYEDGFEKEFGFKPSHADKMANPDTKRMCAMLSKLRKQLKSTKEECSKIMGFENQSKPVIKEAVVNDIEKKLADRRAAAGRSDKIENMSPEEVIEEKCVMQKALLGLEAAYGRPESKEERELVRGLYDRYRTLKRTLLRHAPSKVKESVSELGTILEHEAMEFNPAQPRATTPAATASSDTLEDSPSESLLADLHALPPHQLLELAKTTREEKKRLRRNLREYEQEFQAKTGRKPQKEDRQSLDTLYLEYKNAKAKLRFIDALVAKLK
ncbi:unnamed protein product [Nezara viridula]|uniref:Rho-GAP domain-containing protein n=1 Tax=Nezara viridula TaxID=85310 RepID=A0A9P0H0I0_NEZVI|nr:unnamed protein product [Nezara viridula]